ncbi:MAG: hypothetical protein FWH28_08920 [Clostridiales bacterium]|nr:hypothetical protein [Clostridiales bacterium]
MKITEAKRTYRLQERMRLIQEQRESGISIRAWCATNNIKESNFYYFLREIRKAALQTNEGKSLATEQALVRIELPDSVNPVEGNAFVAGIRMQYKSARLDIPPGTRAEDLIVVLKALDSV